MKLSNPPQHKQGASGFGVGVGKLGRASKIPGGLSERESAILGSATTGVSAKLGVVRAGSRAGASQYAP